MRECGNLGMKEFENLKMWEFGNLKMASEIMHIQGINQS